MKQPSILVLGATGGVGESVARCLSAEGFKVVGSCRTAGQAREITKAGYCHRAICLSLDEPASIDAAFAGLRKSGTAELSGLVNCAAITQPKPLELTSIAELRRTFEINVFGALHAIQLALPFLRPARGRIVMVSSTSGSLGVPLLGAYSASKFALEALADVLRRELMGCGVKVSLVIPGGIKTAMIGRQLAAIDEDLKHLQPGVEAEYARAYRQHRRLIEIADQTGVPPEQVAADVLRALRDARPKARYLCGMPSVTARAVRRVMPDSMMDRIFDYLPASKN